MIYTDPMPPYLKGRKKLARLIILLILGFSAYWLFRQLTDKLKSEAKPPEITQKKMVQCSFCGVHVPQDKSLVHDQKTFCSQEHSALYSQEQDVEADSATDTDKTHDNPHE
jgi:uncharacterized protein